MPPISDSGLTCLTGTSKSKFSIVALTDASGAFISGFSEATRKNERPGYVEPYRVYGKTSVFQGGRLHTTAPFIISGDHFLGFNIHPDVKLGQHLRTQQFSGSGDLRLFSRPSFTADCFASLFSGDHSPTSKSLSCR